MQHYFCLFGKYLLQNESTRAEIESLVKANDVAQLKSKLCRRMEFGTAGKFGLLLFL